MRLSAKVIQQDVTMPQNILQLVKSLAPSALAVTGLLSGVDDDRNNMFNVGRHMVTA